MLKQSIRFLRTLIRKKPIFTIFRVTNRCNLTCGMCSVWKHGDKSQELNLNEIAGLGKILKKLNISIVNLGGGEPFMREDLVEIVKILNKDFNVRMQTNATLANEEKIRKLIKAGLKGVSISLDTLNPQKQDCICNAKNSWYKTIENMILFAKIMPRRGSLLLSNAVVSKLNIQELPQLVLFVNKLGYSAVFLPILLSEKKDHSYTFRDFAPAMGFTKEDYPLIDRVYNELITMKGDGCDITNSFSFLKESKIFLKKNFRWKCDATRLYFHIDADGSFLPCTELRSNYSLFDNNFIEKFNSLEFRTKMQEEIAKCPGCLQPCQVEISKIMHNPTVFLEKARVCLRLSLKKRSYLDYDGAVKYADFNI